MKRARDSLILILLLALVVQVLWRAIAPLLPWASAALVFILIAGTFYYRRRW
jgi:hypothetical protein